MNKTTRYEIGKQDNDKWGLVVFKNGKLDFINLKFKPYSDVKKNLQLLEEIVELAKKEN